MLPFLLTKLGLPVMVEVLSGAFEKIEHPVAKTASKSMKDLERTFAKGLISEAQIQEANRHAEEMAKVKSEEFRASISEVNQSLRAEIASQDIYVRRMRPTFGYLMAMTWAAQMFGLAYVIIFETEKAPQVIEAMASLGMIWGVGLSVLGIYVYKRSEEKKSRL